MWHAIIHTLTVQLGSDASTVEVVAEIMEGQITTGMNVEIVLNGLLSISVPVVSVTNLAKKQVKLVLGCEDNVGANIIEGLNFADETIVVSSSEHN